MSEFFDHLETRSKDARGAGQLELLRAQLNLSASLMGYGVALKDVDIDTLDDLDAVATAFRQTHGIRLRIATKYHRLVREYLRQGGVADYALVDSQGATEGTVANETAEAIADITSSGETLRANHLKILSDGPILRSQATLWRSRNAPVSSDSRQTVAALIEKVAG